MGLLPLGHVSVGYSVSMQLNFLMVLIFFFLFFHAVSLSSRIGGYIGLTGKQNLYREWTNTLGGTKRQSWPMLRG